MQEGISGPRIECLGGRGGTLCPEGTRMECPRGTLYPRTTCPVIDALKQAYRIINFALYLIARVRRRVVSFLNS